ncbi:peptidase U32 family protein [Desulfobacterium sp. N47]|uniref:Uncharacterized protease ydcP n=1 Tax=uncultured Desulfobacterium sp. TaxID=201089 RepID=E1YLP4_9BACT|nr:Uncharacterized protease ydcP [uncultured Desulfobacterium sp.]
MIIPLELLSPAGNVKIGIAAIDHGADAVYIGAPSFSARAAAGNSIEDIAELIRYAHLFAAKVYVALNTIVTDQELPEALKLTRQVYDAGADGLIIQDAGLLELDLPPIPLIASTQMHNTTPEKVKFLEAVGFSRVILARELSLAEIKIIRNQTKVELEFFVHGALCVSYSGQCYMSQAIAKRSANRGVCAQPCRHRYTLSDEDGKKILENKHLLSLKDLSLTGLIPDLVKAGITSFKIEGRYKDAGYVKNITAAFSREIDRFILNNPQYCRAGSGKTSAGFEPDPDKTFNRGYTRHFLFGRIEKVGAIDTSKSLGKCVGKVTEMGKGFFRIDTDRIRNGDGLCFFTPSGVLSGFRVNRVDRDRIYPNTMEELKMGEQLYRNHDHEFLRMLEMSSSVRRVGISLWFQQSDTMIALEVTDEDGNQAKATIETLYQVARNPETAGNRIIGQLSSVGNTIYQLEELSVSPEHPGFLPLSIINRLRREALQLLDQIRVKRYQRKTAVFSPNTASYPETTLGFQANVLNQQAKRFYARHGTVVSEPALEAGGNPTGKRIMTTRYCIRHQLDACPRHTPKAISLKEPLRLTDNHRNYRLSFDCNLCVMHIYLEEQ